MIFIRINKLGANRILNGFDGMVLPVACFTGTINNRGLIAHVKDYRYFQIWSIGPEGYEIIFE